MKEVNTQLRIAGYKREDKRMKCDRAKSWISNTAEEPEKVVYWGILGRMWRGP